MSKNPNETLARPEVTVRIPQEVDAALEQYIAGTGITKREVVEAALRKHLGMERAA